MGDWAAGPALDAAVARRVMGWAEYAHDHAPDAPHWHKPEGVELGPWEVMPAFSTDIAAAWQVVERLVEQGWTVDVEVHSDHTETLCYRWEPDVAYCQFVPTAPLSICLAALAACPVEA